VLLQHGRVYGRDEGETRMDKEGRNERRDENAMRNFRVSTINVRLRGINIERESRKCVTVRPDWV
jgi:hypothetical protein